MAPDNQKWFRYYEPGGQPYETGMMLGHSGNWRCVLRASPVRNCSNLIADRKGWNGWRVLAPHRQYRPARRGQLSSKYMFLFILTVRSAEITWTRLLRVSCFCVSVKFTVSVVWEESRWQMEAWIQGIKNIFILLTGYGEQDSLHTEWNLLWEN